jgi:hypothetical protein
MQAFGFNQDNTGTAASASLGIDSSGNIWLGAAKNNQAVVHMVGLAAPVATPTSAATYPGFNTVTAWSSSSTSTCSPATGGGTGTPYTITFTVPNNFIAPRSGSEGQYVLLHGFGSGSGAFLNYQQVGVLTATSAQFTACIAGGAANENVSSPSGVGVVEFSLLGTRP